VGNKPREDDPRRRHVSADPGSSWEDESGATKTGRKGAQGGEVKSLHGKKMSGGSPDGLQGRTPVPKALAMREKEKATSRIYNWGLGASTEGTEKRAKALKTGGRKEKIHTKKGAEPQDETGPMSLGVDHGEKKNPHPPLFREKNCAI